MYTGARAANRVPRRDDSKLEIFWSAIGVETIDRGSRWSEGKKNRRPRVSESAARFLRLGEH